MYIAYENPPISPIIYPSHNLTFIYKKSIIYTEYFKQKKEVKMKKRLNLLFAVVLLFGGCSVGEYITISNEMNNNQNVELVIYQIDGSVYSVTIEPHGYCEYKLPYAGINALRYTETTMVVRAKIGGRYYSQQQSFTSQTPLVWGGYGFVYHRVWRINEQIFGVYSNGF